jgi:hypothetical protein
MAKVKGRIAEVKPFDGKLMGSDPCNLTSYL